MTTMRGREPFDWNVLVPHVVNPIKVAVIEAMWWVAVPLSATDLAKLITDNRKSDVPRISYHLKTLADAGVLEMVRQRPVRGSTESFYVLR